MLMRDRKQSRKLVSADMLHPIQIKDLYVITMGAIKRSFYNSEQ